MAARKFCAASWAAVRAGLPCVELVAGIAIRPAIEGWLFCPALVFHLRVAPGLRAALVERAPRRVGQFDSAAQLGARQGGLRGAARVVRCARLRLLTRLCPLVRRVVEGAQVSAGEPAVELFGCLARAGARPRDGGMPPGAVRVDGGQDRLAEFEAVGELLVGISAGELRGSVAGLSGAS